MTKRELIAALQALNCPDDEEIRIRMEENVPDENCYEYIIEDLEDNAIWVSPTIY